MRVLGCERVREGRRGCDNNMSAFSITYTLQLHTLHECLNVIIMIIAYKKMRIYNTNISVRLMHIEPYSNTLGNITSTVLDQY